MAIIPMKRLQVAIPEAHREELLKTLMSIGCVEIIKPEFPSSDPECTAWLRWDGSKPTDTLDQLNATKTAITAMNRFCIPEKSKFFHQLRSISHQDLYNQIFISQNFEKVQYLNQLVEDIDACHSEEERILTRKNILSPWKTLDVPLETQSSNRVLIKFGVCPVNTDLSILRERLQDDTPEFVLTVVSSDREQHYLFLLFHQFREEVVESILKDFGFSQIYFKDFRGTPSKNITECDRQISIVAEKRNNLQKKFEDLKDYRQDLEFCFDALTLKARREEIRSRLLRTSRTLFLEGWIPENRINAVVKELIDLEVAFVISEPQDQDEPPVAFQNSGLTAPFGIISSLYGTPSYRSIIDPTPFMAPFFFVFFGMMVSDVAYGLILSLTTIWVLRKLKHDGFLRELFVLVLYCGISTLICGILFGGWFGDIIPSVSKMLTDRQVTIPPLWFDPMKQPMEMLIFSFALGGLQILVGLGLSGYRQIRNGKWLDALFDVGFWYMILIGLVMSLLDLQSGLKMAALGAAGVVLTAGRKERNPAKRILRGILSLYSVVGYLADVLSYSRLLALGLASAVIASVINAMGTIGGKSLGGIITLVVIFIVGHLFNLAISLMGAYVHASRLQYVEFFSKFFEGGGKPFSPFAMDTKYVTAKKEGY